MRRLLLLAALLPGLTAAQPTVAPSLLEPSDGGDLFPDSDLVWEAVSGADAYRVQVTQSGTGFDAPTLDESVSEPSTPDSEERRLENPTLTLGVRYEWRVAARDGDGQGPWSDVWAFEAVGTSDARDRLLPEPLTLTVWPRPARDRLTIDVRGRALGGVRVEAFDALGRRVAVLSEGSAAGLTPLTIDVGGWTPGVYVVRARTGDVGVTARVVVAR